MTAPVSFTLRGRLGVIRLERPDALNALTYDMIQEVERLTRAAESDPAVTAICITGEGRGFCAGIDMSVLTAHASGEAVARSGETKPANPAMFAFLLDISKPVIAAVNGVAAGGGFVLAMMCDMRFMAEGANLITIFSKRGLIAEHGTSWMLPRMVGLSRALDVLWSSRKIDAAEAYRIGLADRTATPEALIEAVEQYANDLAANVSPRALAVIKRQVHRHLEMSLVDAAVESDAWMKVALAHPDAREGAAHFVEKRPARFAPWTGGTK